MNIYPLFTTRRNFLAYKFSTLRMRALSDVFQAMLTGSKSTLEVFPGNEQRLSPSRKLIGIKNIHVAEIVGTLDRETDFDRQFRPLKKHTLDRWVNAYILHEQDGWSPIVVHKIGEKYFVEDGHHRVSVARAIGMEFIEAKVWEYSSQAKAKEACPDCPCLERKSAKAYAAG